MQTKYIKKKGGGGSLIRAIFFGPKFRKRTVRLLGRIRYPESSVINNEPQINPGNGALSSLYVSNKRIKPVME